MKKVFLVLIAFVVIGAIAGCGGSTTTTAAGTTAAPTTTTAAPVTMQMLWWSDGTEGDVMQGLLDQYKNETGVTIELVPVAYADYETRIATMLSGGEAPALARVTEGHLNNFKDNFVSLEDVYDSTGFTNLFYNNDGDVISLPMDITANGLFINTDLCDEYGVQYPTLTNDVPVWTWSEFETQMMKLDGKADVAAPGLFDYQGHRFMPLFYQNGMTLWNTPYTDSNLTSAKAQEVVNTLKGFYDEGLIPRDIYVTKDSASMFRTGQYGFLVSGNWNVSNFQSVDFNWQVVPMPYFTNRATILGGKSLAAFSGSGYEQEAKDFIAWMAQPAHHDAYTGGVPYLTPRLGATVDYGDFTAAYNVFLDEIANTDQMYVQDWLNQVMIPGMYPIINAFVEDIAAPNPDSTIDLLTNLQTDLEDAAAGN